jgi:hypothetical protein
VLSLLECVGADWKTGVWGGGKRGALTGKFAVGVVAGAVALEAARTVIIAATIEAAALIRAATIVAIASIKERLPLALTVKALYACR